MASTVVQDIYADLKGKFVSSSTNFAILKIFVNNEELRDIYDCKVTDHNMNFIQNTCMDSGFDLFVPKTTEFTQPFVTKMVDLEVNTEMVYCNVETDTLTTCGYFVFPRSSMSKTPLMLANHTGIIDSGYRGSLISAFRLLGEGPYVVEKNTRLVQICHPTLCPIFVMFVRKDEFTNSARGQGGFGSTGI
jgi:dUTP pyrophosphatase